MPWQQTIEFLGGATALSLTIGYLGRKAIESYLSGRLEAYRVDLARIANEHSVRFQALHAERGQVLRDLYARLVDLDEMLYSALSSFQRAGGRSLEDKVQDIGNQFNALRAYYLPRQIFLEPRICAKVETILEIAKGIFYDITVYPVDTKDLPSDFDRDVLKERHGFWEKARSAHLRDFVSLKKKLEDEFRKILGLGA